MEELWLPLLTLWLIGATPLLLFVAYVTNKFGPAMGWKASVLLALMAFLWPITVVIVIWWGIYKFIDSKVQHYRRD